MPAQSRPTLTRSRIEDERMSGVSLLELSNDDDSPAFATEGAVTVDVDVRVPVCALRSLITRQACLAILSKVDWE